MSRGASRRIWARSHLWLAVMNAEMLDVDGVRLLWKCMEMSLRNAFFPSPFLWSVFDVRFHKRCNSCFITAGAQKKGVGVRQRGERVGRRGGGGYLWQSLSWVAERSVTYLMSFMHARNLLCVLRREAHNMIHNAWIHLFTGIKVTSQEI